jgi:murein DD-endopeptidase MepM/ murein hydrolase activator NlpD
MVKVDKPAFPPIFDGQVTYPWGALSDRYALGRHTGDDYACPVGTPVFATHAGTVVASLWGADYGLHVVIRAPSGVTAGYCHLVSHRVGVGQVLEAGQRLGRSGASGHVTGPHLHYEERHAPGGFGDDRRPVWNR